MAYLQIKNFTKTFDKVEVLKGIDFELEKGQVLTIIGSSGSGKTTLLRAINFLIDVNDGLMILDGQTLIDTTDKKKISSKQLRERRLNFGLVFQSFNLFPQYSVLDNITIAPNLLLKEQVKEYKAQLKEQGEPFFKRKALAKEMMAQKKKEIEEDGLALLEKIGLLDKIKAYPCELSGGQCQRVAIARALALKPKILCFDEPTSALDPELTGEVLKVIKALKDDGSTMIIVTHEMGFAKKVSDKVIFMADGVIEEEGSAKQIFERPKSEKLKSFLVGISEKDGE